MPLASAHKLHKGQVHGGDCLTRSALPGRVFTEACGWSGGLSYSRETMVK